MPFGEQDQAVQTKGRYRVKVDHGRDALLTEFGKATLRDRYLMPGESYQDMFARVASYYADDAAHAQRLYDYISRLWFMPATPVLSNGGTQRGLPISCFLNEANDSLEGIVGLWNENVWLAAKGGGIGSYWGNLRSIGETVGGNGKTSGIIPFIRVMDSLTLAISQGSLRRGSAAVYLPIDHPEIEEF
ncbi:MAG: ribonucleotide-diphosphate reductase subunit alpha, partial [Alphaproteobacteria bacterium]|nr:ribonucleotide-diphosphate reductase subunit alpha [Alphaproteobacteria bacterium]MDX5415429.1 ribonucleotide-diphosphate reductase subunit alpha [Alphaproteobacteria bacterium]MDX5492657.1 ribonucleotide-diphosphate reductase subunit alpha [Alphaproteobacteria bacterium]